MHKKSTKNTVYYLFKQNQSKPEWVSFFVLCWSSANCRWSPCFSVNDDRNRKKGQAGFVFTDRQRWVSEDCGASINKLVNQSQSQIPGNPLSSTAGNLSVQYLWPSASSPAVSRAKHQLYPTTQKATFRSLSKPSTLCETRFTMWATRCPKSLLWSVFVSYYLNMYCLGNWLWFYTFPVSSVPFLRVDPSLCGFLLIFFLFDLIGVFLILTVYLGYYLVYPAKPLELTRL